MPTHISIDEFVKDEGYPGFEARFLDSPWVFEKANMFQPEDAERFWFLDFHWPNGTTPLGMCFFEDGYVWGTQRAASLTPLPPSNGLSIRFAGVHAYGSETLLKSNWEPDFRGMRIGNALPQFLKDFPDIWSKRSAELEYGLNYFETYQTEGKSLSDLAQFARDARSFQKFAWSLHFELMYPLLANYAGFYGMCGEMNITPAEIAKFLQGERTRVIDGDMALWDMANQARDLGLAKVFQDNTPEAAKAALSDSGANGREWCSRFEAYLQKWGWRTDGVADPLERPWIEDPSRPLGMIRTFLQQDAPHDFAAGLHAARLERDMTISAVRGRLSTQQRGIFDQALATCQHANFSWWNEDHNTLIDMRATIPLRRAATAIASAVGAPDQEDTIFLFFPELIELAEGQRKWADFEHIVDERRAYYQHWKSRREEMPKLLGTVPDEVGDPILIEIVGLHKKFLTAVREDRDPDAEVVLHGIPASKGTVTGIARVLHNADDLHLLTNGDILVCEGTAPSWTPAFTKIAGCVCDNGGTLTHASIVSREYGLPCVVGTGIATTTIRDGVKVEVNGDSGEVRVLS